MNELEKQYPDEISRILAKYPAENRRAAVMPLIYLAQRQRGYVNNHDIQNIGEIAGVSATDVASIVGFYTLYHDRPEGKIRIQVCTDMPCALRGAEEFLQALCEKLDIQPGQTTADGFVTVEEVKCLAACDRAPMFQVQTGTGIFYHEHQTVDTALEVIDTYRKETKEEGA